MSELTEFLLARIAEDEAVARAALSTVEPDEWENPTQTQNHWPADIDFWDRHTPYRILAECEVKRAIVEECGEVLSISVWEYDDTPDLALSMLHLLAAVYADHPDHRAEWRL
jgi:hypothetical protein